MRWSRLSMALALLGLGASALLPAVLADDGPEHLRPGSHTITRGVNQWRAVERLHRTGNFYLCGDSRPPFLGTAGFSRVNFDDLNDCQHNSVYQTAMNFDLSDFGRCTASSSWGGPPSPGMTR